MAPMRLLSALLCSLFFINGFSQMESMNWHFGNGIGLSFSTGVPELTSSAISCALDHTPATISDATGALQLYADQDRVYANNGTTLPNGTFTNFALESIFIPDPGNTDRYYLIRSRGVDGLFYSVVDMTMNGGMGDIPEGLKEINFYNLGGQLMAISKGEGIGYWLISADNDNGNEYCFIRTFEISTTGITFNQEFSTTWLWVGWYNELDDAEISSDCSMISVTFKGHYIGLFAYDNIAGNCTAALSQSVDNNTSLINATEMAFSANSEYLYTIGNFNSIKKYNVTVFTNTAVQASQQTVETSNTNSWNDLKLGVDGNIYILDDQGFIHRIVDADLPTSTFESSVLALPDNAVTTYFPHTPNLTCGVNFFINPQTMDVCLGETTAFTLSSTIIPDSVLWTFGDPESGSLNSSEFANPEHLYSAQGSYEVNTLVWFEGEEFSFDLIANVYAYPDTDLGPDQTICEGEIVTLSAGQANNIVWSTGATSAQIDVSQSGVYSVLATNGICSVTSNIQITVIPQLNVDLGSDILVCDEPSALLTSNQPVVWNTGASSQQITVFETGTYWGTAQNICFTETDTIEVQFINVAPNLLPDRIEACWGDTLYLYTGLPEAEVYWVGNNSPEGDSLEVTSSGAYNVFYYYYGCIAADEVIVTYFPLINPQIFQMPNVFTPNNDAKNDTFHPINPYSDDDPCTLTYLESNMRIYNRWGGLVSDGSCFWDGRTENGNDAEEGVYYYLIELKSTCLGREHVRTIEGDFSLKR
ncbi:MAG: T9SS type B sorting domain-containing protein [Cryomorphaceae bacterium]|nr:T9SS type B sorting domain-containing protein [Cryomorphaceae bacterium]